MPSQSEVINTHLALCRVNRLPYLVEYPVEKFDGLVSEGVIVHVAPILAFCLACKSDGAFVYNRLKNGKQFGCTGY